MDVRYITVYGKEYRVTRGQKGWYLVCRYRKGVGSNRLFRAFRELEGTPYFEALLPHNLNEKGTMPEVPRFIYSQLNQQWT